MSRIVVPVIVVRVTSPFGCLIQHHRNGPLTRYAKLRVAHASGMLGTFPPPPTSKEIASYRSQHASRHVRHARAVMHVGIANPRFRGKRSRYSRHRRNPQLCVSGKSPMITVIRNRDCDTRLNSGNMNDAN